MRRTNLPLPVTSFIGRQRALAEVKQLISTSRLVTITGAGGSGKTRLALEAAKQLPDNYNDGVWLVQLASLRDPALLHQHVLKALGIANAPDRSPIEILQQQLQTKEMLLVMDNCEHLITECAWLIEVIISNSNGLRILATSRESLRLPGEALYPLSGLAWPMNLIDPGARTQDLLQFDAVRLFVERLRAVLPRFELTSDDGYDIVKICQKLDGLPLALELASARGNVLSLRQINDRLDDRFNLLVSELRNEPEPRHQTLRATIDWSFDLLSKLEQVFLRRLSVFASGCSLATAASVCVGGPIKRSQVLELISSLVNKSFVVAQTLQTTEARYTMLETIREYAQEKLFASGEWVSVHERHLECFVELAEQTAPNLNGRYQNLWLDWLEGDYDNFREALAWSLESHRIEAGLRIGIAIYQFWTIRDYVEEGLDWMARLLDQADESISAVTRANALAYAAFLSGFRGKTSEQMKYGARAVELAEAAGEQGKPALRWALAAQSYGAQAANDFQMAYRLGQQTIRLIREVGSAHELGVALSVYSFSAMTVGKYDVARAMLEESLVLLRDMGNPYRIAMALNFSGDLGRLEQDLSKAQMAYEESINILRELGAERDLASALQNLGHACLRQGEAERARSLFEESLRMQQSIQNRPGMAECLIGFAALAAVCDLSSTAACLLAAAVALGGQRIVSEWPATRMEYEHYSGLVRESLTEKEFQAAQAAGAGYSLEQAIAYAESLALDQGAERSSQGAQDVLTPRELEVVVQIARGKSNAEIARELVVSKRTIESHISSIRSKLGFTERTQIVRWAYETGLGDLPG